MEGDLREHLDFVADRRAAISAARRAGVVDESSLAVQYAEGVDEWLERFSRDFDGVRNDRLGWGIRQGQLADVLPNFGADDWNEQFQGDVEVFRGIVGSGLSDEELDAHFAALEMPVVVAAGYSAAEAWDVVRSLPAISSARRRGMPTPLGPLGTGVRNLAAAARGQLQVGFLSVRDLRKILTVGRLAALLAIAIDADGMFGSAAEVLMPSATGNVVCRISQHLAEAKGYYDEAKFD